MPDRYMRNLNGPRGSVLLAAAWVAITHAIAYLPVGGVPARLPSGLELITGAVPLSVYAGLWAAAGVIAAFGSLRDQHGLQRDRWDAGGFAGCVGMLIVWGSTYLLGWAVASLHGTPSRQWIVGALYLGVAAMLAAAARMTNPGSATSRPGTP